MNDFSTYVELSDMIMCVLAGLLYILNTSIPCIGNSGSNLMLLLGHFQQSIIFRAERHFLLFKDQLAESGRRKTKENIIPRGKFRLVENDPQWVDKILHKHYKIE